MKTSVFCLLLIPALSLPASTLHAQIYKWKDAHGTVHFSQAPPAQGTRYDRVKTNINATPVDAGRAGNPDSTSTATPASAPAPSSRTVADTPANRKALCASLDKNLEALRGSGPVVVKQGDKFKALDPGQRKQQLAAAQASQQQYCQTH